MNILIYIECVTDTLILKGRKTHLYSSTMADVVWLRKNTTEGWYVGGNRTPNFDPDEMFAKRKWHQ